MSLPANAPNWLGRALSDRDYVYTVFEALKEREETRQLASTTALQSSRSRSNGNDQQQRTSSATRRLSGWSSRLADALKHGGGSSSSRPNADDDGDRAHVRSLEERYRISVGAHPDNRVQNRYANIIPYDRTRVRVAPAAVLAAALGPYPPPPSTAPFNSMGSGIQSSRRANEARRDWADESDYLNANWVRELWGGQWYAAAQAPLRETAHVFLSLFLAPDARPPPELAPEFYQDTDGANGSAGRRNSSNSVRGGHKCQMRTAVQLTVSAEGGQTKAHPYFHASEVGRAFVVAPPRGSSAPPLEVRLEREEQLPNARCVKSVLRVVPCRARVRAGGGTHELAEREKVEELGPAVHFTHLLFTHWPDYGVPQGKDKAALVEFARLVADVNRRPAPDPEREENTSASPVSSTSESLSEPQGTPLPPIAINCSAGIGRTGTFIALSSLLRAHGLLLSSYPPSTPESHPALSPSPLGPLPNREQTGSVDVYEDTVAQEVDALREQRPMMVQSPAQLMLIYELLGAAFIEADIRRKKRSSQSEQMQ